MTPHPRSHSLRTLAASAWAAALLLTACATLPSDAAEATVSGPGARFPAAMPKVVGYDDGWLGRLSHELVGSAADVAQYGQVRARLEDLMLARLACGKVDDLDALSEMIFAWRACKHLPEVLKLTGKTDGRKLAEWLSAHPTVSRLFYRALGDLKKPEEGIERLAELVAADEAGVVGWPDLAVAFATASPAEYPRPQPNPAGLVESFHWYAKPPGKLKLDISGLPYELLRFFADTRLSIAERKWALSGYAKAAAPTQAYFDLHYDMEHLLNGAPRKNEAADYTLPNLRRLGGVCFDQAYYASEVCKAVGIPATVVFGRGGSGVPHSWFAYYKPTVGGGGSWDAQTGRYQQHLYLMGLVRDPAGGQKIADSVLSVLGVSMMMPPLQREQADAAAILAGFVRSAVADGKKADVALLKPAADEYVKKTAGDPSAPKANTSWATARRMVDVTLAEDLITEALSRNLVNGPAWDLVVDMRRANELPPAHTGRFLSVLIGKTAKSYPDYSFTIFMRIVPSIPDPGEREAAYRQAMEIYKSRSDLQGRILMALGDDYLDSKQGEKAVQSYESAAKSCIQLAEIVIKASGKAEDLQVAAGQRDRAITMYKNLFAGCKKDGMAGIFRNQTSHYQLGLRLATLMEEVGRKGEAAGVRSQIEN